MSVDDVALRIEVLPASFGDCLVVSVPGIFTMVVDTGPGRSTVRRLHQRLETMPERNGTRLVDLFVITHIDSDHIAGATALLEDDGLRFGDVWFNGRKEVTTRGSAQADAVSVALERLSIPHNRAFGGGPVVIPARGDPWQSVDLGEGYPQVTLLSPGPRQLESLATVWPEVVRRYAAGESDSASADALRGGSRLHRPPIDLEQLAAVPYDEDDSIPNASSIAMLVEHRGRSLLLTGDGVSSVYGRSLARLMLRRGPSRTRLDVTKLAHHGSRRNTEADLALLGSEHYLISSNNKRYGLPDDETVARLVRISPRAPIFWFNYETPLNLRWQAVAAAQGTFSVRYPNDPDGGVTLELAPREEGRD